MLCVLDSFLGGSFGSVKPDWELLNITIGLELAGTVFNVFKLIVTLFFHVFGLSYVLILLLQNGVPR